MTHLDYTITEGGTITADKQVEKQEFGKLRFTLKQDERSSTIPDSTKMHSIQFSKSAIQETSMNKDSNSEIDDKFVQWIGRVLEVTGETFTARIDPIRHNTTSKIAKFNINNVTVLNSDKLEEGATFYWTVGLFRNKKGTYVKKSEVRFRLPIVPNKQAVDELAMIEAQKLFDGIGWLE